MIRKLRGNTLYLYCRIRYVNDLSSMIANTNDSLDLSQRIPNNESNLDYCAADLFFGFSGCLTKNYSLYRIFVK